MGIRKLSGQHSGPAWPPWDEHFFATPGGAHLLSNLRPSGGGGGGGATTLNALTDVDAGSPSDGQQLTWINANSAWEAAAAGGALAINDLTDVAAAAPNDGDFIRWVNANVAWESVLVAIVTNLDDLADVDASAPADTNVLTWVNSNSAWEAVAVAAGAAALNDLTDVDAAAPTDGYALKWVNGNSAWEAASVGALTAALDDLTDVSAAAPSDTNVLTWVTANSAWEAAAAAAGGGGGGTHRWNMFSPPAGGSTYPLIVVNDTLTVVKVRCIHRGSGSVDVNVTKNLRGAPADVIVADLTSAATWTASATLSVGVVDGDELDVELVGVTGNVELVTVQVEIS